MNESRKRNQMKYCGNVEWVCGWKDGWKDGRKEQRAKATTQQSFPPLPDDVLYTVRYFIPGTVYIYILIGCGTRRQ